MCRAISRCCATWLSSSPRTSLPVTSLTPILSINTMSTMPQAAIIYARYSTDKQRETSIEDQARVCRARAEALHLEVVAVHADDELSGSTPVASRPRGKALLADALAGRFPGDAPRRARSPLARPSRTRNDHSPPGASRHSYSRVLGCLRLDRVRTQTPSQHAWAHQRNLPRRPARQDPSRPRRASRAWLSCRRDLLWLPISGR